MGTVAHHESIIDPGLRAIGGPTAKTMRVR
jgi:hypothetical protein